MYTPESLEKLRQHVDIVDVLGEYVQLKKVGSIYKGLCPFHNEKTASFAVNRSSGFYHCFGCHVHGDTISFVINFFDYSFVDAINFLAKRYNLELEEKQSHTKEIENNKFILRKICFLAQEFFRFCLFRLSEGHAATSYLYKRGITVDSIHRFKLGYAPKKHLFVSAMKELRIDEESLVKAGFLHAEHSYFLFEDRIIFPIHDALGNTIGFSARSRHAHSGGSKYINSFDSSLFKKSSVLFGLHFCRQRIVKERHLILVEGQLDCLQMIEHGLNITVATLGTAFGDSHLHHFDKLGVRKVFLLFDGDEAGKTAALKIGNIIQSHGIEVKVCLLPKGQDPDSFLMHKGINALTDLLNASEEFLSFLVISLSLKYNLQSPVEKSELIEIVVSKVKEWKDPIIVHETLKKFASLMQIPEELLNSKMMLSLPKPVLINHHSTPNKKEAMCLIDVDLILETDIIRWLIFGYQRKEIAKTIFYYLEDVYFIVQDCKALFSACRIAYQEEKNVDLLQASFLIKDINVIELVVNKKINLDLQNHDFLESIQKILDRKWLKEKEDIKTLISSKQHSEEVWDLVKDFDALQHKRVLATPIA